jgi:hypothetical protein
VTEKNGRILFNRLKPTVGCSASGRRRRIRRRRRRRRRRRSRIRIRRRRRRRRRRNEHLAPSHTKYNTVQLCTGARCHCFVNPDTSKLTAIQRCPQTGNVTQYLQTDLQLFTFLKSNITCKRSAKGCQGVCYGGVGEGLRHGCTYS